MLVSANLGVPGVSRIHPVRTLNFAIHGRVCQTVSHVKPAVLDPNSTPDVIVLRPVVQLSFFPGVIVRLAQLPRLWTGSVKLHVTDSTTNRSAATTVTQDARSDRPLLGIGYMVVGVIFVASMNSLAKWLLQDHHVVQVVWARFTGHFIVVCIVFLPQIGLTLFRSRRPALAFLRSGSMFLSNVMIFIAFSLMPLANATAIAMTTPILVVLLAVPWLGEKIGIRSVIGAGVGLVGALLIVRPDLGAASFANLAALAAALLYTIYQLLNRQLAEFDSPQTLVLYTALVAAVVTTAIIPFYFELPISPLHTAGFLLLGVMGALCQFLVIKSYQNAQASVVAPFHYVELVAAVALGFVIFGDFPDPVTWAGIALIVFAGLYLAYRERRRIRR